VLLLRPTELASSYQEIAELKEKLASSGEARTEIESLKNERESVRVRVEAMLANLDELL
jgi:cell shape-determining protein MreC